MNYEVIREDDQKLTRQRWRFWVNGTRVILDKACADSRLARKTRQVEPDAPLYIPDSDPEAQVYYVLTAAGWAEVRKLELDERFGPLTEG